MLAFFWWKLVQGVVGQQIVATYKSLFKNESVGNDGSDHDSDSDSDSDSDADSSVSGGSVLGSGTEKKSLQSGQQQQCFKQ